MAKHRTDAHVWEANQRQEHTQRHMAKKTTQMDETELGMLGITTYNYDYDYIF